MLEAPEFFLPAAADPEQAERAYAHFAQTIHKSVPAMSERIYSITYKHDGAEWTATVGEQLHGTKYKITGKGINKRETEYPVSDPATVLAIFPGDPYIVVTNHRISIGNSAWENPFMAGRPSNVIYFKSNKV